MNLPINYTTFSEEDIESFQPAQKVGLLATISPEGLPHLTLLSSLMASSNTQVAFGQFTEGMSKINLYSNPKAGFLIMSLNKDLWRGKASFTHTAKQGKDYDFYNNIPMFRYNAYFGIHTVYYLDLVSHTGKQALPMTQIILAALQTMLVRKLSRKLSDQVVLNQWTRTFLNKLDHLKFLAYIGSDGYPVIIPCVQAQSLDAQHVLFSTSVYTQELNAIPAGISMAVFGMALTMEDVLMRGTFQGIHRIGGIHTGVVQVDWVYNSMPPVPGQIYPPIEVKAVEQF